MVLSWDYLEGNLQRYSAEVVNLKRLNRVELAMKVSLCHLF